MFAAWAITDRVINRRRSVTAPPVVAPVLPPPVVALHP
jgi:hypothetical protein